MKRAFIYARVSTEEQAENGKSIETQIRLCNKWAKENDFRIVQQFVDEGKSATTINRPGLQDMLIKCQEKGIVDAILVQDTDRLARNTTDHLNIKTILKKKSIVVISISQPMIDDSPEGNLVDTIMAGVNAFQSQLTGRKVSKVLEEKAKMGWYPGGTPALGYKNSDNPNPVGTLDKKIITVDYEIAPIIKQVFEMYATGNYSAKSIAEFLNNKGLKSPLKHKIHISYAVLILKNIFYLGDFNWNNKVYKGKHEPIISKELFDKVQEILRDHNQNATRQRKHKFLLRGFLICDVCGNRFWAEKHIKNNGNEYEHYFCSHCKKSSYVDKEEMENKIKKVFAKIEISKDYAEEIVEKAKDILKNTRNNQDTERRRLERRKSELEKALREAEDSRFIDRKINDDQFIRLSNRYQGEIENVGQELNKLGKDYSKSLESLRNLVALAENIGKAYKEADFHQKRTYLSIFFKYFKIRDGKVVNYRLTDEVKTLIKNGSIRVRKNGLRLVDAFCNRKIEFGFTLQNIQTVFETFEITPAYAY